MNVYKARLSKSVLLPQTDAMHLIPLIPLIDIGLFALPWLFGTGTNTVVFRHDQTIHQTI